MLLANFNLEVEHNKKTNKIPDKDMEDYRLTIFDHEEFSYEITGIELDEETKRIIIRVKDSILVPISRKRQNLNCSEGRQTKTL